MKCNLSNEYSVCLLTETFGFIATVVVTFQKMCTMIGSALDKLGNSQPPKFADLSAPGSSPTGVSCDFQLCHVRSNLFKCSCQEIKLKLN